MGGLTDEVRARLVGHVRPFSVFAPPGLRCHHSAARVLWCIVSLPWIKLAVDMPDHPKCDELAAELGDPDAWRLPVALWCFAAKYRPSGDLEGLTAAVIAKRARYAGDPERFIIAMRSVGFLDGFVLHDFAETNGAHAAKLERDRERSRDRRATVAGPSREEKATSQNRSVGEERRGEEKREEEITRASYRSAPLPPPEYAGLPPGRARTRPEPHGPYGEEMPETLDGVLAHETNGQTLHARLAAKNPVLGWEGCRSEAQKALAHRDALDGQRRRLWSWPTACLGKIEDWCARAERQAVDAQTATARAARAGVHTPPPSAKPRPSDDELERHRVARKKLWVETAANLGLPPPPEPGGAGSLEYMEQHPEFRRIVQSPKRRNG